MQSKKPSSHAPSFHGAALPQRSGLGMKLALASCLVLAGVLAGGSWRLHAMSLRLEESQTVNHRLFLQTEQDNTRLAALSEELTAAKKSLQDKATELQSLTDRTSNLEAQRAHLRAECERQSDRARAAESNLEALQSDLQAAQHEALLQSQLPDQLTGQLTAAQHRIEELEAFLDQRAEKEIEAPLLRTVLGSSSDGSVFALDGEGLDASRFPRDILLASGDSLVLSGRIHRMEGTAVIGQVVRWHRPASALVKGEKVFILDTSNHE